MIADLNEPGSFRDKSGFVFYVNGEVYRQVNSSYRLNYDMLVNSGLYQTLTNNKWLLSHEEQNTKKAVTGSAYKIIKPVKIPFISYPYEWCFSQLKDAALLTLKIQLITLDYGMSLKDASAYNIQFYEGKPIFIDTLSFEKYINGSPWIAYRQFCQHFLAPLLLMKFKDIRLNQLLKIFLDGIPLDIAAKLLPIRSKCSFNVFSHIVMHAKSQKHFGAKEIKPINYKMSNFQLRALIDGLQSYILKLNCHLKGSEWEDYYNNTNYSDKAVNSKKEITKTFLAKTPEGRVFDFGRNVGIYSRIANSLGRETICFDIDPAAVEKNYLEMKKENELNLLPLVMDITNASPGIGWQNEERQSLNQRGKAETALVLALIHHIAISNNVPMYKIAEYLHSICQYCIIEWIPINDSQVQRLLATREEVFPDYTREQFEMQFKSKFEIIDVAPIEESERILYLMKSICT